MQGREFKALKELQNQSSSPYNTLLASSGGSGLTGWKKVRPCAEYNLTSPLSGPSKKLHREYKIHRTKLPPPPASSYMSGDLDENYSYSYNEGLSKRCQREISSHSTHPPPFTNSQWNPKTFTTVYLDPIASQPSNFQLMEAQLQSNLSKIVAMQMKPELLLEQIIIENRLRSMGCLHAPSLHNIHSLNLEGVGFNPKSIHHLDRGLAGAWQKSVNKAVQSKSAPSLITPLQQQQQQQAAKAKKKRQKPQFTLEWCSLQQSNTDITAPVHSTNGTIMAAARREVAGMNDLLSVKTHPSSSSKATTVTGWRQRNGVPPNSDVAGTKFRLPSLVPHTSGTMNHSGNYRQEDGPGGAGLRLPGNHVTYPVAPFDGGAGDSAGRGGGGGFARGKQGLWHQPNRQKQKVRSLN